MTILKIRFFHVRKGPNTGIKSNFQGPMTSNGWDYPGQPQIVPLLSLGYIAAPLQNAIRCCAFLTVNQMSRRFMSHRPLTRRLLPTTGPAPFRVAEDTTARIQTCSKSYVLTDQTPPSVLFQVPSCQAPLATHRDFSRLRLNLSVYRLICADTSETLVNSSVDIWNIFKTKDNKRAKLKKSFVFILEGVQIECLAKIRFMANIIRDKLANFLHWGIW